MNHLKLALFSFLLLVCVDVIGQDQLTAMKAYGMVTRYRDAADSLWDKDHPTSVELHKALDILQQGLGYLDQPGISDLAQGNRYLKFRKYNILFDVVHIYDMLGDKDKAIAALQEMYDIGGYSDYIFTRDTSLKTLPLDPRFNSIKNEVANRRSLWAPDALKTPYKEDIPLSEKVAGLSLLWSQAKYNFVHFDHANIDWNKSYLDYLNKISATKSTAEYYELLERFYAELKDGHTNVYFPKELFNQFYARPPLRTELIEGRVFVTDVFNDSLEKLGISKGLEVVSINGQPVLEYAKEKVEPYQSSSTPQDMEVRKFTYALLAGAKNERILLGLKDRKGRTWSQSIERSDYSNARSIPVLQYKEIDNIGYLALNGFDDPLLTKQFDSLFPQIFKTKGLIIDLRRNGGGSGGIGFHVLASLTDKPFKISRSKVTQFNSNEGGDAQWFFNEQDEIQPNKKQYYSKPVVVLTSARTFSAAEDFVVAFDYMKRGKLVGQTTGGSTGQPLFFDLPGGGTARVCAKDDYYPDGKKFVGYGIEPDIFVKRTIEDLQAGRDAALEKAIQLLK